MRRLLVVLFALLMPQMLHAQYVDDEMKSLIDAVVTLRQQSNANFNKTVERLAADSRWTPMNETGALKDGECQPADNVPTFKLNRILTKAEASRRYVSQRGDFLNGEDERYNYSLYERSVKAESTVTFTLKGRTGAQTFVIIPFDANANLSAELSSSDVTFTKVKNEKNMLLFKSDTGQKNNSYITIKVKNLDRKNHAFVIINHNSRDGKNDVNEAFHLKMDELFSQGNRYYDLNNALMIKKIADSMDILLKKQNTENKLTLTDSLRFTADILKLNGDYHYVNGSLNPKSYQNARGCFENALQILNLNKTIDRNHLKTVIHHELAQLFYKQKLYPEALAQMDSVCADYRQMIDNQDISESDDDYLDLLSQRAICLARNKNFADAEANINKVINLYNDKKNDGYYEALRKKAKIITLRDDGKDLDIALSLYKQYFDYQKVVCSERLSAMTDSEKEQFWMRMRPFVADCYCLEGYAPAFLYDVTLFLKGLLLEINRMDDNAAFVSWHDIQRNLDRGCCAIEFVQYEKNNSQHMAALLVGSNDAPRFIKLTNPDEVLCHNIYRNRDVKRLVNSPKFSDWKNVLYNDSLLKEMVWTQPLLDAISPYEMVYFSPDGYMHRLAIEYLMPERAADKKMRRLTSTRRLLDNNHRATNANALIIGDVNYNAANAANTSATNNDITAYNFYCKGRYSFGQLENSGSEINTIKSIRNNQDDTLISGTQATEAAFRSLCGNYSFVMISTHGYCMSNGGTDATDLKPCLSDDALPGNILAFAGVNRTLADANFDASNNYDGIVSAREMYNMDMSNAQLVVLSACMTGLGHISADGVYGIQRGLKNAGAGAMVVSLWEAHDEASNIQMSEFQKAMKNTDDIGDAFYESRLKLLNDNEFSHPKYSNTYIIIDAVK